MSNKKLRFNYFDSIELLKKIYLFNLKQDNFFFEVIQKKNQILTYYENQLIFKFRLPLTFPVISTQLSEYIEEIDEIPGSYVIILIQSGHCSIGFYEYDELIDHKVIQKYMVRKKQGKSQITYLNKKGKSREGSRLRLANTKAFFEEINDRLSYYDFDDIERIIMSCPKSLIPLLFQSKVKTPFNKKDPRLIKVPIDVKKPNHQELIKINKFSHFGFLDVYQDDLFEKIIE